MVALNNGRAEIGSDGSTRDSEEIAGIRAAVRALCAKFPGEYWRALDRERAYPTEFVAALTEAGFLAALIPEEYGGSGLHDVGRGRDHGGNPRRRLQRRRLPRADVHDGHAAAARQRRRRSSATCRRSRRGELRLQAFGVTEPTSGTDTLALRTTAVRDGKTATSSTARRSGPRAPSIPT